MSNPALRIAGPAAITYKGASFASQGDIALNAANATFDLQSAAYGVLDSRSSGKTVSLTFTPVGTWANLAVLWPAALQVIGGLTTPARSFLAAAVNTSTDVVTIVGHGWATGAAARIFSFGTMPTGLTAGTLYFLRRVDADTITLHPTRADAVADTNKINITAAGAGRHRIIEQEPLEIISADGERHTFHVAALAGMPEITGSTQATLIGEVTFDCFRKAGVPATTANSLYTLDDTTYTPPAIDPATILTQAYLLSWGGAPWANLETVAGVRVTPAVTLVDVGDDSEGVTAKRVDNFGVTARAQVLGVHHSDVMGRLKLQDAGAQLGGVLATADDLVVAGSGVLVTMTCAGLRAGPQTFGRSADRVGELEWFASRKFTAGVPEPLFSVGTGS